MSSVLLVDELNYLAHSLEVDLVAFGEQLLECSEVCGDLFAVMPDEFVLIVLIYLGVCGHGP